MNKEEAVKRQEGYYWVQYKGKFIIANWSKITECWYTTSLNRVIKDSDFEYINETRVEQPKSNSNLDVELTKKLLLEYRDENLPGWSQPYHYEAEGWQTMQYFLDWLERKQIQESKMK